MTLLTTLNNVKFWPLLEIAQVGQRKASGLGRGIQIKEDNDGRHRGKEATQHDLRASGDRGPRDVASVLGHFRSVSQVQVLEESGFRLARINTN